MENINEFCLRGYTARYMHSAASGKPVMIFLMGSLQEIESIQVFNRAFSDDFDYWAVELPGSGNTSPLHPKHSVDFLAEFLEEFISVKNLRNINLVACSYATAIALEYAKRSENELEKLVLAGSMQNIPLSEWPTMLQLMRDCAFDTQQFAHGFIDLLTVPNSGIERQDTIRKAAVRKAAKYKEANFWHFVFNTIRLMCYEPRDLHKITVPALVFTGEFDPYVTPSRCKELSEELMYSQYEVIEGCDHLFHIEKPNETVRLILDFIASDANSIAA